MKNTTQTSSASDDGCNACHAEHPDYYYCMKCLAMVCESCKIHKDGKDIGCKLCIPASALMQKSSAHTTPAHTVGPWDYERLNDHYVTGAEMFRILTDAPTHPDIADVFYRDTDEEAEANARLIAAAPELLEHLQNIVEMAHSVSANWENGDLADAVRNLDRIACAAEIAIAKANRKEA